MANALAGALSPYLLQHQDNPVDWLPWGKAAFDRAQALDRPVLLSVGYAACHWCHVMAHESFENEDIAQLINANFIAIKLDREERPDLDAIYQKALALMGQAGGWPLTMFLTPEAQPFFGGTYFPPTARYGRPGFAQVLDQISAIWTADRDKAHTNAAILMDALNAEQPVPGTPAPDDSLRTARALLAAIDSVRGGTRGAPKFPQPPLFAFLLRTALRTGDEAMRRAVTLTLENLCQGGIYDHLGGGFMRYSTDADWLVPHFEKMLCDNALLVDLLVLAWQADGDPLWRQRATETIGWALSEMRTPGGTFAASLDADSQGGEGAFYSWSAAEIDALIGVRPDFKAAYDVSPTGNWEGRTILRLNHRPRAADSFADERARLLAAREARPRPQRDDKILADWNAMMIKALADAGLAFDRPDWIAAARQAFDTIAATMARPDNRLAHAMRDGQIGETGLLDDLAHMGLAALALAEAQGDLALVAMAQGWAEAALRHHRDAESGAFFQSANDAGDIIARQRPIFDGALPSANAAMALLLARLWRFTGDDGWRDRADACLAAFAGLIPDQGPAMPALFEALDFLSHPVEVTISGEGEQDLLRAVAVSALPGRTLFRRPGTGPAQATICRDFACGPPIADAGRLRQELRAR